MSTCPQCDGHVALNTPHRLGWLALVVGLRYVKCAMCGKRYWTFGTTTPRFGS